MSHKVSFMTEREEEIFDWWYGVGGIVALLVFIGVELLICVAILLTN